MNSAKGRGFNTALPASPLPGLAFVGQAWLSHHHRNTPQKYNGGQAAAGTVPRSAGDARHGSVPIVVRLQFESVVHKMRLHQHVRGLSGM